MIQFLYGSNDNLFGGSGGDDRKGGAGADHFDCGKGNDANIGFPSTTGRHKDI